MIIVVTSRRDGLELHRKSQFSDDLPQLQDWLTLSCPSTVALQGLETFDIVHTETHTLAFRAPIATPLALPWLLQYCFVLFTLRRALRLW